MLPKRQKIQYCAIGHVLHPPQQSSMHYKSQRIVYTLKAGNKYSKHVSSWSKELRDIRVKLQEREKKMKKPTAVFLFAVLLFIATVCTVRLY